MDTLNIPPRIGVWRGRKSCIACQSWSLDTLGCCIQRQSGDWCLNSAFPIQLDLPGQCTRLAAKEYSLRVPMRQRPHGDHTKLLPGTLEPHKPLGLIKRRVFLPKHVQQRGILIFMLLQAAYEAQMDPPPWRPKQDNTTGIHGRSQPCPLPSAHTLPHI